MDGNQVAKDFLTAKVGDVTAHEEAIALSASVSPLRAVACVAAIGSDALPTWGYELSGGIASPTTAWTQNGLSGDSCILREQLAADIRHIYATDTAFSADAGDVGV